LDNRGRERRAEFAPPIAKSGKPVGDELSDGAISWVVEQSAKQIGIEHLDPHDLRRTCANFSGKNGVDLERIKFLFGHLSIQTTEGYLERGQHHLWALSKAKEGARDVVCGGSAGPFSVH
jgi:integrase